MPTYGGSSVRWQWFRSTSKLNRGSTFLWAEGRTRRKWRVLDRQFNRISKLYEHQIIPA
jgi:hypothetical protein